MLDVPRADPAVLDSLESVSSVVVVANQDVATIRSAARMAAALEQRYGKERVNVVISRYDARAEIGQADVERVIGRPVTCLFPNNYPTALASHEQRASARARQSHQTRERVYDVRQSLGWCARRASGTSEVNRFSIAHRRSPLNLTRYAV